MKKILLSLFLCTTILAFSATKTSNTKLQKDKEQIIEVFETYINSMKDDTNIDDLNISKDDINKVFGLEKSGSGAELGKLFSTVFSLFDEDVLKKQVMFTKKVRSKLSYKIKDVFVNGNEAVMNVHMKSPNLLYYSDSDDLSKNLESAVENKNMKVEDFLKKSITAQFEKYEKVLEKPDLKYLDKDIKVYFTKYDGDWIPSYDFEKNKDFFNMLSFGMMDRIDREKNKD